MRQLLDTNLFAIWSFRRAKTLYLLWKQLCHSTYLNSKQHSTYLNSQGWSIPFSFHEHSWNYFAEIWHWNNIHAAHLNVSHRGFFQYSDLPLTDTFFIFICQTCIRLHVLMNIFDLKLLNTMHVHWLMQHDSFVKCFDLAFSQSTWITSNTLAWQEDVIVLVSQFLWKHFNLGPNNTQISSS